MANSKNGAITIYDIAKEAGVSPATVSRVLTNSANVRAEKKERILALINKYNFQPNELAKGLSDPKRKIIGIISADIQNPYYAAMFAACEAAADAAGYNVMLYNSRGKTEIEESQLEMLVRQRVDAIIQLGGRADDLVTSPEYAGKVNKIVKNIPIVVTGKLDGTASYRVSIDSARAIELLLEHLLSLGHERIAWIGGRLDVTSTYEKYQHFVEVLQKHQIELHPEFFYYGGYAYSDGYEGILKIAKLKNRPTAVIAVNDFAAAGVIRGAAECGIRVPEDMSVAGYDNTYIAEMMFPSLTTIDYNYAKYGETLIHTAIVAAEKTETVPFVQRIEPKLIVRESTAQRQKGL